MLEELNRKAAEHLWKKLEKCFAPEIDKIADDFIETLLTLMSLVFIFDHNYRKNIQNFEGSYVFKSADGGVAASAVFKKSKMKVLHKEIDNPNVTVIFSNGRALLNFIFSPSQDILQSMLNNDLKTAGNLNYIYRFGFLAKKLQLLMSPQ